MSSDFLEMRNIVKRFPGVLALDNVSLSVKKGEVHALLGENGSGKSTLMKILSGAYSKDSGEIMINGEPVTINNSQDSQRLGISIVYQELNLIEQLTVAENVFMGKQRMGNKHMVNWKAMYEESQKMLDEFEINIDSHLLIRDLGVAQKQMVEIIKALTNNAQVLVLDEPTAPLTNHEIEMLFKTIEKLKAKGVAIIYISHRLEEIMRICDRITIIRDGLNICQLNVSETNTEEIIRYMVGREITEKYPKVKAEIGEEVLRVEHIRAGKAVQDVSFSVRAGEVLGIAGLVGAGRTETMHAIFGMSERDGGKIFVEGKEVEINQPIDAIRAGIGFATEDRKGEGLVLPMSVGQNITLSSLEKVAGPAGINLKKERDTFIDYIDKLNIKTPSYMQLARNLSGGNQQKVVLAKWLLNKAKVIILDEPTRGIDVGAKVEVYNIINDLVKQGVAVIMISSELPEVLGMSDRVVVMCQGRVTGVCDNDDLTQEVLMNFATGEKTNV